MARVRAVPRRRPNINFQQRGNINFERQRVATTRNISSSESSAASSASNSAAASPARSLARSPLGNLARNLAMDIGRNPQRNQARSPPIRRRIRAYDVKIKFVLPRVKNVEVKHRGNVVRRMKVRRVAKHAAKKGTSDTDKKTEIVNYFLSKYHKSCVIKKFVMM